MTPPRPQFEFKDGSRPAFTVGVGESVIGHAPACDVQLDMAGVADKHARLVVDSAGVVWLENYEPTMYTVHNGERVSGRARLADGDTIEIGMATLVFHSEGGAAENKKVGSEERTMIGSEMPEELRAFLKQRAAAATAAAPATTPAAPAPAAPKPAPARTVELEASQIVDDKGAGAMIGRPEPEPPNNRTVQMAPADLSQLGLDPKAAPAASADPWEDAPPTVMDSRPPPSWEAAKPAAKPAAPAAAKPAAPAAAKPAAPAAAKPAAPAAAKPAAPAAPAKPVGMDPATRQQARSTIVGFPQMQNPLQPAAAKPIKPTPASPPQELKTTMMDAPVLPKPAAATPSPSGPAAAPQELKTTMMDAPVLPKPAAASPSPSPGAPQEIKTTMMESPVLPPRPTPVVPAPAPVEAAAPKLGATHYSLKPEETAPASGPYVPSPPPSTPFVAVAPEPAPKPGYATPPSGTPAYNPAIVPYTPPAQRSSFGSYGRAFAFMSQMLSLAQQNRTLLKPLFYDLAITTPLSVLLAIAMGFVHSQGAAYALLSVGVGMLYFVDYACNSLTASLIYDQMSTGQANISDAMPRAKRAFGGIMVFAAVSALLDVASTYARERDDVLSRILLRVLRAIWTTATYVIMPALVLEGIPFGAAFDRSKKLMDQDPTGVGAGVVAMSIVSYAVGAVVFPSAYFLMRVGAHVHPAVGGILFFLMVNVYWSVSGWLKIAYSTCFYMWARQCEQQGSQNPALAPNPLRYALEAA